MEKLDLQIDQRVADGRPVQTHYAIRIDMGNGLSAREKAILFNSARSCHVHKMLAGDTSFAFEKV